MKYKHIVNGKILFETDNAIDFMLYLINNKDASQAKYSVLYNLLEKSNGYVCEMETANYRREIV